MNKILDILNNVRPELNFEESDNFIDDGMLDSFDIVLIISAIEEEYHIKISGLEVIPENFESVETIKNLILKSGGQLE